MSEKIISKEQVDKTAKLARIQLTEKEQEKFTEEMAVILDNFKDINEIDTSEIESFNHYELVENNLRNDEIEEASDVTKKIIKKNFPDKKDDYLKVKAVL